MILTKNRRRIEELEKELRVREEELNTLKTQMLQNQIRPHFIFNTLLAIKQLCIEEPAAAAQAIQNFASYLRANLEAMTVTECVPFSKELSCIKEYIALEQADPASKFRVEYDIRFEDFTLPLLSVQPIVENAVRHGVVSNANGGLISISTAREGSNAVIVVADNGSGMSSSTAQQEEHRSIGMKNTKERLKLMCGGDFNIATTGHGTIVHFTIPIQIEATCKEAADKGDKP